MNPEVGFQLPLSGSLFAHNRNTPHPQQLTFNSLSRDHEYKGVEVDDDGYAFFQLPLSGSPPNTGVLRSAKTLRIFQLPLSGSPIAQRAIQRIVDKAFQLPLSGSQVSGRVTYSVWLNTFNSLSRDHTLLIVSTTRARPKPLSTPSLGITCQRCLDLSPRSSPFNSLSRDHQRCYSSTTDRLKNTTFNSLSRDHRALFRDFPALRGFPPRRPFAHLYFSATI